MDCPLLPQTLYLQMVYLSVTSGDHFHAKAAPNPRFLEATFPANPSVLPVTKRSSSFLQFLQILAFNLHPPLDLSLQSHSLTTSLLVYWYPQPGSRSDKPHADPHHITLSSFTNLRTHYQECITTNTGHTLDQQQCHHPVQDTCLTSLDVTEH